MGGASVKPGDLVRVRNYFRNAQFVPGGTHGIVLHVEGRYHVDSAPMAEVLVADGFFNHYTLNNLEAISEAR